MHSFPYIFRTEIRTLDKFSFDFVNLLELKFWISLFIINQQYIFIMFLGVKCINQVNDINNPSEYRYE